MSRCSTTRPTARRLRSPGLIELLDDEYAADRVLDIQWVTDHLATLGAISIPREDYVRRVARAVDLPLPKAFS